MPIDHLGGRGFRGWRCQGAGGDWFDLGDMKDWVDPLHGGGESETYCNRIDNLLYREWSQEPGRQLPGLHLQREGQRMRDTPADPLDIAGPWYAYGWLFGNHGCWISVELHEQSSILCDIVEDGLALKGQQPPSPGPETGEAGSQGSTQRVTCQWQN